VALAQSADKTAAVALFDEAASLVAAGNYKDACPKYAESNRLDPQLGALMHLADCYEKAGQLASAWASFRDASEIAEKKNDPRAGIAADRAKALEPRISRLAVVVPKETAVPGLEIRRDGEVVNRATWGSALPVDIGDHQIEASAPGKQTWQGVAKVTAEGSRDSISIPALQDAVEAPSATPGAPATGDTGAEKPAVANGKTQKIIGLSLAGAGAVGLIVGVVFEAQKSSKLSTRDGIACNTGPTGDMCTPQQGSDITNLTSQARTAWAVGTTGLIAGTLLIGGGLTLFFTAPKAKSETKVSLSPVVAPSFQGLTVRSTLW
jgi:hypothetical protein